MYVWRNKDLPPDPYFPADLKKLGYFINDNDQIRQIANPEEGFKFKINRNDRYNIKQREAMNDCIRPIILDRLMDAGVEILRLPLDREATEAHVPILISKDFHQKSHIIVFFGEPTQDLGVWAYRAIHDGINIGSVVNFARAVLSDERKDEVGLLIANTGQLIWHNGSQRAVTQQTWQAIPRPYANWGQATMSWRNKIPAHGDWSQHVQYIFEKVLWPKVGQHTRIDIIGMAEGGLAALRYLQRDCDPQQTTYSDLDMGTLTDPLSFTSFIASRCRGYILSSESVGTPQPGYRLYGCNCYSSGESLNTECIMTAAWKDMLAWLDAIHLDPEYSEHVMLRVEDMDEDMRRELEEQVDSEGDEAADLEWQRVLEVAAQAEREAKAKEVNPDMGVHEEAGSLENPGDVSREMQNLEVVDTDAA